ncbi:MAG: response regulator transcription factor [Thioalkalivibrionaceae bacterium]
MDLIVIEDDPRIADFLLRGMSAEGHRVEVFERGVPGMLALREAHREARRTAAPVPIAIVDRMLPDINGVDICRSLRADGVDSPILMLTALDAVEDRVAGLQAGADDYLPKPFAFEELLARIEALARRARPTDGPRMTLRIGDLELDRVRRQAIRNGVLIELTAKEFGILELLMQSPGRPYSAERILSTVWGQSADPLTNVVQVYIRRLRAKIDVASQPSLIQTRRGIGYAVVESIASAHDRAPDERSG